MGPGPWRSGPIYGQPCLAQVRGLAPGLALRPPFDPGVDQIANLVRDITACALDEGASGPAPGSRRVGSGALLFQALPLCHLPTQFSVRARCPSCAMTMRSADSLGVPWNLASYCSRTCSRTRSTRTCPRTSAQGVGRIVIRFGDAHIYVRNHLTRFVLSCAREHRLLPAPGPARRHGRVLFQADHALVNGYDPHPAPARAGRGLIMDPIVKATSATLTDPSPIEL